MKCVLFACNHNAGRSQMAQAFFERHAPPDIRAESAGTRPAREVWPEVVQVMAEVGIDISGRKPRKLLREMQLHADWAVTMGCGDACPYFANHRRGVGHARPRRAPDRRSPRHPRRHRAADPRAHRPTPRRDPLRHHHDVGLELLYNSAATAAGLFAIILMSGPVSGRHFNPVVSLVGAAFGGLSRRDALAYIPAQVAGCITGAVVANTMFALSAISISTHHRASPAHLFAEVIATLGLLLAIFALARTGRASTAPAAVGAYIGAAYWFTGSTSFANPAITIGCIFSDTFAGIAPASVPSFTVAQLVGSGVAVVVVRVLYPDVGPAVADDVVVPHDETWRVGRARVDAGAAQPNT